MGHVISGRMECLSAMSGISVRKSTERTSQGLCCCTCVDNNSVDAQAIVISGRMECLSAMSGISVRKSTDRTSQGLCCCTCVDNNSVDAQAAPSQALWRACHAKMALHSEGPKNRQAFCCYAVAHHKLNHKIARIHNFVTSSRGHPGAEDLQLTNPTK